jgi:hypothetical protein
VTDIGDALHGRILKAVKAAELKATDENRVDLMNGMRRIERDISDRRRSLESETEPYTKGEVFQMKQGTVTRRSYNTSGLLAKLFGNSAYDHMAPLMVIKELIELDVIRLTWQWSKLRQLLDRLDLGLTVVPHEIEDGDPNADVGEVKKRGSASYVSIE